MGQNGTAHTVKLKSKETWLFLLLLLTPLRAITIVLSPLVVYYIYQRFCIRLSQRRYFYMLLFLFIISSAFGLIVGTTTIYNILLSCCVFLPMLFMLFGRPAGIADPDIREKSIATPFLHFLLIIDFLGLCYWLRHFGGDEYGWAYGRHYEYVHGLGMINIYVFLYYSMKLLYSRLSKKDWAVFIFIAFSVLACGYGLGFICLFLTFLVLLLFMGRSKSLVIILVLALGVYGISRSSLFLYERSNIAKLAENVDVRKKTMFQDFFRLIRKDPQILLTGTGPGGYNSRSTFLLCGDNDNLINKAIGYVEPPYYKKYIYPLWNKTFVSQDNFTDGTRNKPFSSFVSIWAELGTVFMLIVCVMYYRLARRHKSYKRTNRVGYYYLLSLDIFMILSLVSHMWIESTEFIVYCLIRYYVICSLKNMNSASRP